MRIDHCKLSLLLALAVLLSSCGGAVTDGQGNSGPSTVIDVVMVYGQTLAAAVDSSQMRLTAFRALEETNEIYQRSGSNVRFQLVGVRPVTYTGSGDHLIDINWARVSGEAVALRNAYGADLICFLSGTSYPQVLGAAYINGFASTISYGAMRGSLHTLSHELTHNLGARHSDGVALSGGRVTLMGTAIFSGGRLPYLSNPDRKYYDLSLAGNTRAITRNQARTASNFRSSQVRASGTLEATVNENTIQIQVQAQVQSSVTGSVQRIHLIKNGHIVQSTDAAPYQFTIEDAHSGVHRLSAVVETSDGGFFPINSTLGIEVMQNLQVDALPWLVRNIGVVTQSTATPLASDHFSLRTEGAILDPSDARDHGAFLYQRIEGNFDFSARAFMSSGIVSGGIGIRASLDSGAMSEGFFNFAGASMRKGRYDTNAGLNSFGFGPSFLGTYFRISRSGNQINTYTSDNGVDWDLFTSIETKMPHIAYIGCISGGDMLEFDQIRLSISGSLTDLRQLAIPFSNN